MEPLKYFTQTISLKHSSGFIVVQGLLPAVGFAVLASMCLKEKTELKYFVAAIMFFTVLPAKIWLGISAALIVMYKTRPRKKK